MATQAKRKTAGKTARRETGTKAAGSSGSRKTLATAGSKKASAKTASPKRWSRQVTEHSDALDLKQGVFTLKSPKAIATSLKRSAERSARRKSDPFRSAMSMLNFYINRGGHNLPTTRKTTLEKAKEDLRHQFGRA